MDEAAAAAITEDGAGKRPHRGDTASENTVGSSAEDTDDGKYPAAVIQKLKGIPVHHQGVQALWPTPTSAQEDWNACGKISAILRQMHNANS